MGKDAKGPLHHNSSMKTQVEIAENSVVCSSSIQNDAEGFLAIQYDTDEHRKGLIFSLG